MVRVGWAVATLVVAGAVGCSASAPVVVPLSPGAQGALVVVERGALRSFFPWAPGRPGLRFEDPEEITAVAVASYPRPLDEYELLSPGGELRWFASAPLGAVAAPLPRPGSWVRGPLGGPFEELPASAFATTYPDEVALSGCPDPDLFATNTTGLSKVPTLMVAQSSTQAWVFQEDRPEQVFRCPGSNARCEVTLLGPGRVRCATADERGVSWLGRDPGVVEAWDARGRRLESFPLPAGSALVGIVARGGEVWVLREDDTLVTRAGDWGAPRALRPPGSAPTSRCTIPFGTPRLWWDGPGRGTALLASCAMVRFDLDAGTASPVSLGPSAPTNPQGLAYTRDAQREVVAVQSPGATGAQVFARWTGASEFEPIALGDPAFTPLAVRGGDIWVQEDRPGMFRIVSVHGWAGRPELAGVSCAPAFPGEPVRIGDRLVAVRLKTDEAVLQWWDLVPLSPDR